MIYFTYIIIIFLLLFYLFLIPYIIYGNPCTRFFLTADRSVGPPLLEADRSVGPPLVEGVNLTLLVFAFGVGFAAFCNCSTSSSTLFFSVLLFFVALFFVFEAALFFGVFAASFFNIFLLS